MITNHIVSMTLSFNLRINFLAIILFFGLAMGAQENKVNIELRDYHSAKVTDVVASTKYPYFFTADESGKILAYDSETKRVIKTIRPATGVPVKTLRLANNDELLTVNQKASFSDASFDSIINIRLYDQKVFQKFQGDFEFIGNQEDAIIMQGTNPEKTLNIIDLYDRSYQKINRYFVAGPVSMAAYDSVSKTMAMVEGRRTRLKISLQVGNDYENEIKIEVPERLEIKDLFFEGNMLFAITTDVERNSIEVYDLTASDKFANSIHIIKDYPTNHINVEHFTKDKSRKIIITAQSTFPVSPLILEKQGTNFKEIQPKNEKGAVLSLFLAKTNEILFFENYNEYTTSALKFAVFDIQKQKISSVIPEDARPFYSGMILPQDNWIIFGQEWDSGTGVGGYKKQVKFYDAGTFNNRFGSLAYQNYLEVRHGVVDLSFDHFKINKNTGLIPFYGYKKVSENENTYGFFVYNILEDKVRSLSTKNVDQLHIVDFNVSTEDLLLSTEEYTNGGYTEPQKFIILNGSQITELRGQFKFGKFSGNGKYLLLITDQNKVLIKDVKNQKTIFSKNLKDGKYRLFNDGEKDFIVSNSFFEINLDSCNQSSIALSISDDDKVESKTYDCLNVIDIATKGDISVLAIKDLGLVMGEEIFKFPYSEFPEKISLSEDGKNLMASFSNGKIKVLGVEDMEPVLEMIHPKKDEHIFVNQDNFYFSNTDPEDYIVASSEGKLVPVRSLEDKYFDPAEVLSSLGEPNTEYLNLLNKALSLRKDNLYVNKEVDLEKEVSTHPSSAGKGDLYLLSVGISDYEDSKYDLTFADKDALDMARIYGKLSEEELISYRTKFFGHRFELKEQNRGDLGSINKYYEYSSLYDLYPLTRDGRYWLEKAYDDFFLWDFEKNTTLSIKLPEDVSLESYIWNTMVFPGTIDSGFLIKTDNGDFYRYDFKTRIFYPLQLPESIKGKNTSENLTFLEGHDWILFTSQWGAKDYEIVLTRGNFGTDEKDSLSFKADVYKIRSAEGVVIDTSFVSNANLEAISGNGKHLLYSDVQRQLYYKNLERPKELPLKLTIPKLQSLDRLSIADDGKTFIIKRTEDETFHEKILSYSITGELLDKKALGENIIGLLIHDNDVLMVSMEEPLVQEEFMNKDELIEKNQPASFENVFVHHLVNDEANAVSVEKAIQQSFKNARPEDQIILFIAGHGVLDKSANYFFAPHDMDFQEVSKNGLAFNKIIETLNKSKANNKLLLMDTCHSGNTLDLDPDTTVSTQTITGQRGAKATRTESTPQFKLSDVVSDVFDNFLSNSGITVVSASSGADVAYENKDLGNGAFTSAYINLLKEKWIAEGLVISEDRLKQSIDLTKEDISKILKQVMLLTNGKQIPDLREINTHATLKMW